MFLSEFELAPNIVITLLFHLNTGCHTSGNAHMVPTRPVCPQLITWQSQLYLWPKQTLTYGTKNSMDFQTWWHWGCYKFDKQIPNLCPNQFYLYSTQASYTQRKIFIKPPKFVAEPWSIALFHHNRRGYQRCTRPDQCASKYAPEQTTDGTYMPHGHFIIFILSSFFYLSSETTYDFLVKPIWFLTSLQRLS